MSGAPLPPSLKKRLAPLLRLQSSPNDGERANASAAINRLLEKHGADWHCLVDALLAEPRPAPPPPPPTGSTWKRTNGPATLPRAQLLELLEVIEARTPFMSLKAQTFVTSLRDRNRHRPTASLSAKQWDWLQDLIEATGV